MSSTTATEPSARQSQAAEIYHSDSYSWAVDQADALRRRDFDAVDWDHVIEEIEDVGDRHRDSWTSLCSRTIEHLLLIEHYREAEQNTLDFWIRELRNFRLQMASNIRKHPGLQGQYQSMFTDAWEDGRESARLKLVDYDKSKASAAAEKTLLRQRDRSLPKQCPYRLDDVTAFDFKRNEQVPRTDVWPPSVARVLNSRLSEDYPVRQGRTQEQEFDWGR